MINEGQIAFLKKNKLKLKGIYANQSKFKTGGVGEKIIYDRDQMEFGRLPKETSHETSFAAMKLLTKAEEQGFELALESLETFFDAKYNVLLQEHKSKIEVLIQENERLADALEQEQLK